MEVQEFSLFVPDPLLSDQTQHAARAENGTRALLAVFRYGSVVVGVGCFSGGSLSSSTQPGAFLFFLAVTLEFGSSADVGVVRADVLF